jgi:hypothetical protein
MEERYIGDGVHASFDGYQIWLKTDRGGAVHSIALEPGTFNSLVEYQRDIMRSLNSPQEADGS